MVITGGGQQVEVEEGIVGIKGNGEKSPIKMNCLERGGKGRGMEGRNMYCFT